MKTTKWLNYDWDKEPQTITGKAFAQFVRDFRSDVKLVIKDTGWEVWNISAGHYFLSGFLRHPETGKFIYISIPDVRYFNNEWNTSVLFRTAKTDKDFTGGSNYICTLKYLGQQLERAVNWSWELS